MDDSAIIATSRDVMREKLRIFNDTAEKLNMSKHPTKTKYIAINDNTSESFFMGGMEIKRCNSYDYLGTIISANTLSDQIAAQTKVKQAQALKFYSFLNKNYDAPFYVKKKVWESALTSSIMYSCETWLTNNVKSINKIYNESLKNLLGVRKSTCNDIIFVETGIPDAKTFIKNRQYNFFRKLYNSSYYQGSYIQKVINLVKYYRTPAARYIISIENINDDIKNKFLCDVKTEIITSVSSKRVAYRNLNPELNIHAIYNSNIAEYKRIETTRLRLISHNLRIETQRWSRIAAENRLCNCGLVQTEEHILCHCPLTENIRNRLEYDNCNFETIADLMKADPGKLSDFIFEALGKIYQEQ